MDSKWCVAFKLLGPNVSHCLSNALGCTSSLISTQRARAWSVGARGKSTQRSQSIEPRITYNPAPTMYRPAPTIIPAISWFLSTVLSVSPSSEC